MRPRRPLPPVRRIALLLTLLSTLAGTARAAQPPGRPIVRPFAPKTLVGYAAALARGEMAVVETDAAGRAGQITLLGYAAAPPEVVRALVADPALYPRYIRNLTRSEVERRPDGALVNRWRLSYPIGSFEGADEVRPLPASGAAPGEVGAVEIRSLGAGLYGTFRWEFLPAPGGGTVVVDAGFYDPLDNAILRAMIGQDPALDAGFNLAGGLSVLRALLKEAGAAARAAGHRVDAPVAAGALDLQPLLSRGTLAILRTAADGRLVDVSVTARAPAAPGPLRALVRAPDLWPRLVRPIRRVLIRERDPDGMTLRMTVSALLFDVEADLRVHLFPEGADYLGVGGALRGARFRWDIQPDGPGGSVVVWRGNVHLGDSSSLVRTMFRIEPSFEHSANVSIGLISVRGLLAEAKRSLTP